jgi:hypothetical protein
LLFILVTPIAMIQLKAWEISACRLARLLLTGLAKEEPECSRLLSVERGDYREWKASSATIVGCSLQRRNHLFTAMMNLPNTEPAQIAYFTAKAYNRRALSSQDLPHIPQVLEIFRWQLVRSSIPTPKISLCAWPSPVC